MLLGKSMLENKYELEYWAKDQYVMGIDEAGRGPLCGPLVVACCILPLNYINEDINDSKKLTAKKREVLYDTIVKDAHYFDIKVVTPEEIDSLNIYAATKKAMDKLSKSSKIHSLTITDAMPLNRYDVVDMVKGDAKSISVAAASIIAKVTRDRIMDEYDKMYPQYEFSKHKGYPTKRHLELMKEYGLIKGLYRMSYKPCKDANEIKLF